MVVSSKKLENLVSKYLENFFNKKLETLRTFDIRESLSKVNPYSLMIEGNENASEIVEALMRVHVNSLDKTMFDEAFWTEITGDPDFYLKLVSLMKEDPAKHKQKYAPAWDAAINRFTAEFIRDFCFPDGHIDWEKLVCFVSEDTAKR